MKRIWIPNEAKSGSCAPRPKSAPRGRHRSLFDRGFGQLFELRFFFLDLIGEPTFSFHQYSVYPYESNLQLEKFFESEVGEFRVTSQYAF